jgi:uncharacterized protein (DUF488 family)
MPESPLTFYTIGHSNRSLSSLVEMLHSAPADMVVDVRAFPRSRSNPQFNIDTLPAALQQESIGYRHLRALGGRRDSQAESDGGNAYWTNASFRNYADYAATDTFRDGLAELRELGREHACAIMCSEALWWRCHRRMIADYLLAGGDQVLHIMAADKVEPAELTSSAVRAADGTLRYPADQLSLF